MTRRTPFCTGNPEWWIAFMLYVNRLSCCTEYCRGGMFIRIQRDMAGNLIAVNLPTSAPLPQGITVYRRRVTSRIEALRYVIDRPWLLNQRGSYEKKV